MQEMIWDNTMSVNVESLDAQHKTLFAIINELGGAMDSGITDVAIGSVLSKLIVYAQNHFEYEENCMAVACFANHEEHKCEHAALIKKVKTYEQEYLSGKTSVAVDVMNLLQQWLRHHIMKIDRQYSSHLVQSGVQ